MASLTDPANMWGKQSELQLEEVLETSENLYFWSGAGQLRGCTFARLWVQYLHHRDSSCPWRNEFLPNWWLILCQFIINNWRYANSYVMQTIWESLVSWWYISLIILMTIISLSLVALLTSDQALQWWRWGWKKCGKSHVCYRSNRLDSGSSSGGGGTGHAQWRPVLTSEGGRETGHEN